MNPKRLRIFCSKIVPLLAGCCALFYLGGCAVPDRKHAIIISVPDQKMMVLKLGVPIAEYSVSTSKFCLGDERGKHGTPLGKMEIAKKIGGTAPSGMVFKDRKPTGEILRPDAPGRDPVLTRILWLRGLEPGNSHTYSRYIYIHGTPEERNIGRPASFGCVRMRSRDVIALFNTVGVGAQVQILNQPMSELVQVNPVQVKSAVQQVGSKVGQVEH